MNYKPVTSSNINAIGYDPETKTLGIKFKDGNEYHYSGVTADKHEAILKAKSIGSHFHQHVRSHHKHKKIENKPIHTKK